jgi:hypothetical protein
MDHLTADIVDTLINFETMAQAIGITPRTLSRWRRLDEQHGLFFPDVISIGPSRLVSVSQAARWAHQHHRTLSL